MMMRSFWMGLLAVVLALTGSIDARADDLVAKIQSRYESLSAFKAEFTQTLTNKASGEAEKRKGTLHFMQPHLIRWETHAPEKELLVVGQDAAWDYFPDEDSVYKYPLSQVLDSKTMVRFVSGQARLDQDFLIERKGEEKGWVRLDLVPKEPEPGLVQASLWAEADTGLLRKVLLFDFYGNENELTVTSIKLNPTLSPSLFAFIPPKGVEIFDNTGEEKKVEQKELSQ